MDIPAQKLKLIEWILGLNDPIFLKKLEVIAHSEKDWWDELPPEAKASIERGVAEANSGQFISHEEAMKDFKKWL